MTLSDMQQLIARNGLHFGDEGAPLINKRGGRYNWLFDLRRVFMDAHALTAIAAAFWQRYADHPPFQLAGMETGAIPLLTALMLSAPPQRGAVNGVIIRKARKTSGLARALEGELRDLPVLLLDDTLNSGTSAEKACAVLSMAGHEVRELFVVIDFQSERGMHWRERRGITVNTLFTLADFDLPADTRSPAPTQAWRERWRTATPGGIAYHVVPKSAPLLVGDRLYRGCDAAKMQAFSTETGGVLWEFEATGAAGSRKGIWSSPAYHQGRIYFGAYNGTLYCLDADTGQEIWAHPDGEWVGSSPLIVPQHNLVCVGIEYARPWAQGSLAAYNLDHGEKVWEHQVRGLQHGSAAYWPEGDLVIWGSADHEMLALRAKTGEIAWRFPTRRSVKYAPAIDSTRRLTAFASFDKSIYLLDVATGEKRGEWPTGEICYTTPLFVGNKLFCGSGDRHLYIIDVDRMTLLKRINLGARVYASPCAVEDRVVVATNGGRVIEIDVDTLEIKGILQLPDAVTNAVALSDDGRRLYVSTYMNHLYAFDRLREGEQAAPRTDAPVPALSPVEAIKETQRWLSFEQIRHDVEVSALLAEAASTPIHQPSLAHFAAQYPHCMRWLTAFAQQEGKRLSAAALVIFPSPAHTQHAPSAAYEDSYHLILASAADARMICGDEAVAPEAGDLWWVDNRSITVTHSGSGAPSVHLVFQLAFAE